MSLVISSALVLADVADALSLDHPVIGYHNLVAVDNIAATEADASYPVTNLANPATHLKWKGTTTGVQYLTITTGYVDQIDYLAVAAHNFSSGGIAVSVEGFISGVWTNIVDEVMLPNDGPYIGRFTAQSLSQIRLKLAAGTAIPEAAVLYVGKLLVMERRIYAGHTPMPHGRKTAVVNGRSESGNFLGRIVTGAWRETVASFSQISPAWFRTYMDPFLEVAAELPFFFGWRPETYPREIGYGALMEDPEPMPVEPANLISFELKISGVV